MESELLLKVAGGGQSLLCQELEPPLQIGQCVMPKGGSFTEAGVSV